MQYNSPLLQSLQFNLRLKVVEPAHRSRLSNGVRPGKWYEETSDLSYPIALLGA